jgi:hypothetical protein
MILKARSTITHLSHDQSIARISKLHIWTGLPEANRQTFKGRSSLLLYLRLYPRQQPGSVVVKYNQFDRICLFYHSHLLKYRDYFVLLLLNRLNIILDKKHLFKIKIYELDIYLSMVKF